MEGEMKEFTKINILFSIALPVLFAAIRIQRDPHPDLYYENTFFLNEKCFWRFILHPMHHRSSQKTKPLFLTAFFLLKMTIDNHF